MDVWRLLNAEIDGNVLRHPSCHSPQVARESFTIGVVEDQRRKIHGGEVREHVQHCQPSLVPASDGCSVIERMLRDVGEVDWTEDVSNTNHRGTYITANRARTISRPAPPEDVVRLCGDSCAAVARQTNATDQTAQRLRPTRDAIRRQLACVTGSGTPAVGGGSPRGASETMAGDISAFCIAPGRD